MPQEYICELTTKALKDGDLSDIYINEQGQIIVTQPSFQYHLGCYMMSIFQDGKVCPGVSFSTPERTQHALFSSIIRKWNWLMHHSSAEKNHLLEIYSILHLIGNNDVVRYPGLQCLHGPGSIAFTSAEPMVSEDSLVVGKIPVGPIEWAVGWTVYNNDSVRSPMCRCA